MSPSLSPTNEDATLRELWPKLQQWARVWQNRLEYEDAVQVLAMSALLTIRAGETSVGIIKHRCKTALINELRHQFGDMRFPNSPRVIANKTMLYLDDDSEDAPVARHPSCGGGIEDVEDRLLDVVLTEQARLLLAQIEDPYEAYVARRRYLAGQTNVQVAAELGVSSNYVAKLSKSARTLLATLNPRE